MAAVVREAVARDADALASLAAALGYPLEVGVARQRLVTLPAGHAVFVALDDRGAVVGWVHVRVDHSLLVDRSAQIGGLVVAEGHRSQGIGRRLMETAEAWARTNRCRALWIRSGGQRAAAHRFYEELSYRWVKDQIVLVKDLAAGDG